MPRPWTDREVQKFTEKAQRAMRDHRLGGELVRRFLRQLAPDAAPPTCECPRRPCRRGEPVADLVTWSGAHSLAELAGHIAAVDDEPFAQSLKTRRSALLLAWWSAGPTWKRGRGDLIHNRQRAKWWDLRTK